MSLDDTGWCYIYSMRMPNEGATSFFTQSVKCCHLTWWAQGLSFFRNGRTRNSKETCWWTWISADTHCGYTSRFKTNAVLENPDSEKTIHLGVPVLKNRCAWGVSVPKNWCPWEFRFRKIDALGSSFSENRCTWVLARKNRCTLGARAIDFLRSRQGDHSLTTTRLWRHPVLHTATRHHSQVFRPWAVVAAAAAATTSLLISFGRARACQPPGAACLSHTFQLFHNFAKGFIAESASFSD